MSQLPQEPAVSQDDLDNMFNDLRQNLSLLGVNDVTGSPTKVGLRTLLVGAQLEYRVMVVMFMRYIRKQPATGNRDFDSFASYFPDLFQNNFIQGQELPSFHFPSIANDIAHGAIPPKSVHHSLANLGLAPETNDIVGVIKALFAMLKNEDNLLKEFDAMVRSERGELQVDQDVVSTDQTEKAAALASTKKFHAFLDQYWLNGIGGGKEERLSYYLSNMLALSVIPRIIG
ncbi:hypothetical protein H4R34_002587 [Dimargaris verticillata]|uniref:Uncharacterized protein n=1 Tax=Dimargaris verticillata TaxID=2761393 RepID=A0A9W8B3U7_9FUNG|nr:hypothetical protein H4R34_002587 [Dimargaris verticillata]